MAESAQGPVAGQVNSNVPAILQSQGTGSVSSPANQINEEALIDDKRKIDALQRQVAELKFNSEKVDEKNQKLKQEIDITKQMKDELEKKLAKEKEKREQALTRLSEVAGAKLTENNAAIADLSDIHRPQKLGEMFSEIYDNDWTDAYEELQGHKAHKGLKGCDDEIIATKLVQVLYTCNKYCSEQAGCLLTNLSDVIRNVGLPNTTESFLPGSSSKKIKDFGKSLGVDLLPRIRESYFKSKELPTSAMSKYTAKCLQFCWYAALQDPPVFIGQQNDNMEVHFDPNMYREFTKKGRFVDFVVWPILYLQEGGALLAKGVVQCKEDKKKKDQEGKEDVSSTIKQKQEAPISNASEATPKEKKKKTAANATNETKQSAKESLHAEMQNMTSTIAPSNDQALPMQQTAKPNYSQTMPIVKSAKNGNTNSFAKSQLPKEPNISQQKDSSTKGSPTKSKEAGPHAQSKNSNANTPTANVVNKSDSSSVHKETSVSNANLKCAKTKDKNEPKFVSKINI